VAEKTIDPVTTSVVVEAPVDRAWEVFTEDLRTWWPMKDFSVEGEGSEAFVEDRLGGRFYERTADGEEHEWGVLTAWEPPQRIAFTWHPGTPEDQATEVEVRFTPEGDDRTRVDLEHRGWEKLGDSAQGMRDAYEQGWPAVLAPYAEVLKS
jgi:uncharacterized protein YndB with AHSA1/START domain